MKSPTPLGGERAWKSAWAEFAAEDASAAPSPHLEARARREHRPAPAIHEQPHRWPLGALMTAAALLLVAAGVIGGLSRTRVAPPEVGSRNPPAQDLEQPGAMAPEKQPPATAARRAGPAVAVTGADATSVDSVPLAVDLEPPPETVQLVRIRMPVAALAALGIATTDPDATGVVDVDVTVGDDGLARDIRGIHAVPAAEHE